MSNNENILEEYGAAIYNAMNARHITLGQIAFETKTSPRSFARIRDGEVAPPENVINIIDSIFQDKKISSLGKKIINQYGKNGSSKVPMGSNSQYADRVAHKYVSLVNSSNSSLPFDAHKAAAILGVKYTNLISAISQSLITFGKTASKAIKIDSHK